MSWKVVGIALRISFEMLSGLRALPWVTFLRLLSKTSCKEGL